MKSSDFERRTLILKTSPFQFRVEITQMRCENHPGLYRHPGAIHYMKVVDGDQGGSESLLFVDRRGGGQQALLNATFVGTWASVWHETSRLIFLNGCTDDLSSSDDVSSLSSKWLWQVSSIRGQCKLPQRCLSLDYSVLHAVHHHRCWWLLFGYFVDFLEKKRKL